MAVERGKFRDKLTKPHTLSLSVSVIVITERKVIVICSIAFSVIFSFLFYFILLENEMRRKERRRIEHFFHLQQLSSRWQYGIVTSLSIIFPFPSLLVCKFLLIATTISTVRIPPQSIAISIIPGNFFLM